MKTEIELFINDIAHDAIVEYNICGRNRSATYLDPPEHEYAKVNSIVVDCIDITSILDLDVIDGIERDIYNDYVNDDCNNH